MTTPPRRILELRTGDTEPAIVGTYHVIDRSGDRDTALWDGECWIYPETAPDYLYGEPYKPGVTYWYQESVVEADVQQLLDALQALKAERDALALEREQHKNEAAKQFDRYNNLVRCKLQDLERMALDHLALAWNTVETMDLTPETKAEFRTGMHSLQNIIARCVAWRVNPETWNKP